MAKRTLVNQLGGKVQVVVNDAEEQIALTDYDDGGASEVTTDLYINKVIVGSTGVNILRGSNTVLQLAGPYTYDFAGMGMAITVDSTATCNVVCGSGETCIIEFAKQGTFDSEY